MNYKFLIAALLLVQSAFSQQTFITSGKLVFERKTNMHRLFFKGEENSWSQEIKKLTPQFKTNVFELLFNGNQSLYQPGKETEAKKIGFFPMPADENTVYRNLQNGTSVSQKQVFESRFLITDTNQHFKWKILPETRTIAGFECRKAITTICDSVVVVAFYTDEIVPATGPESFSGLPGMIMEIAIPRLYTTWVATRLEMVDAKTTAKIEPPKKGKNSTPQEVATAVQQGVKSFDSEYAHRSMWFITL